MGTESAIQSGQPAGKVVRTSQPPVPAARPRAAAPAPAGNRPAGNPSAGSSPAAGAGTPDRPRAGAAEEKKVSRLALVSDAPPVPETPKKKQQRKPRKKKEEPQSFNADQISALILSTSAIVGSRPGLEIWTLQPQEAQQLATPIANMIAKSEKLQNMGEYADAISLVTASLIIFAPRAFMFADQQKQKKISQNGGVKLVRTDSKKAEGSRGNERPSKPSPAPAAEYDSGILAAIPSTI